MLRQGTNRLNQGHGSDGSGRGSERTGSCARGEGSVKAAALSAEATTPVVISQGSGRAQSTAQLEVQWLGLETLNWGAGSLVTAADEASGGRTGLQQGFTGSSGHGWEGENVKWHVGQPPPLFI